MLAIEAIRTSLCSQYTVDMHIRNIKTATFAGDTAIITQVKTPKSFLQRHLDILEECIYDRKIKINPLKSTNVDVI